MVSIKKNNKGELALAKGIRTRKSSIYSPGQNEVFKISRSRFSNFCDCKRCFFLDRVKGLQSPSMPGWSLNTTVDELLKKEFDFYREKKEPHPIFKHYNLNFIPYQHKDIDQWRESLKGGISYHDEDTNLILHGGVDDVWYDLDEKKLVVADYKAQSTKYEVEKVSYLNSQYHQGYKMQMDIYVHILRKMGFKVSDTSYFMVCNGVKTRDSFDSVMNFDITLVDYKVDISWVQKKINEMKDTLESEKIPEETPHCESCAYIREANNFNNNN